MNEEPSKPKGIWANLAKRDDVVKYSLGIALMIIAPKLLEKLAGSQSVEVIWVLASLLILVAVAATILGFCAYHRSQTTLRTLSEHLDKSVTEFHSLASRIASLERLPLNADKLASWILCNEGLQRLERAKTKKSCPEIWVVTKKPQEDSGGSAWAPVIKNNIKDGINYVYICPNNPLATGGLQGLREVFRGRLTQCKVKLLEPSEFDRLPYSEIVVYDPKNAVSALECLCEIDAPEPGWWLRLINHHRNLVLGRLKQIASEAESLEKF